MLIVATAYAIEKAASTALITSTTSLAILSVGFFIALLLLLPIDEKARNTK